MPPAQTGTEGGENTIEKEKRGEKVCGEEPNNPPHSSKTSSSGTSRPNSIMGHQVQHHIIIPTQKTITGQKGVGETKNTYKHTPHLTRVVVPCL
jgi:hypothetical protein